MQAASNIEQKETAVAPSEDRDTAYQLFLQAYPSYVHTSLLDEMRHSEYKRLDEQKQVYLDYTGGGLHAESQLRAHMDLLSRTVLGNPHSNNPTSAAMTDLVEDTRHFVLDYFHASSDEYIAVFTPNASGALKHIGESYAFEPGSHYLLTFDNHNSVNGIREFAQKKGASVTYVPLMSPLLCIDQEKLEECLDEADPNKNNLFAYPAQSNFSGVKHPLELVEQAHSKGWDVLLDAAAFVPTNRLDLSQIKPDFVSISFYKMFGYPTGLGCLLIRKMAYSKLSRPWFAGGTVNFVTIQGRGHYLAADEVAFEDGTVDYLNIPAIKNGLQHINSIGIETISTRVDCLTGWLIQNLLELRHSNGRPIIRLYGSPNTKMRGGTITINFYDPNDNLLDYRRVEELANEHNISLRTGCFCNPGANEMAEGLTEAEMLASLQDEKGMTMPRFLTLIQNKSNKSSGAIRVSVGIATNFADVYHFLQFASSFRDQTHLSIGQVTFDIENCRVIRDGS